MGEFNVTVIGEGVVSATLPIQQHWLPLSNLDLLLPAVDVHVIFCYKKPQNDDEFNQNVSVLKKGLAQALVSFYAFAGQLVKNSIGEPELLCNNRGVDFIEAFADVNLCDLHLYNPVLCFEGKLLPMKKNDGILSVQVTQLQCGAIIIGCAFDHRVADAYSANMFWTAWAEISTTTSKKPDAIIQQPCFRRSLLNPRHPLHHPLSLGLDKVYVPVSTLLTHKQNDDSDDPILSRIYHITANNLTRIQCLASNNSSNGNMRSKLQSFSAFLWKVIASSQYGRDQNMSSYCKLGIVVDGRRRLSEGEDKEKSASLFSYFGNVLSIPFGEVKCQDLNNMSLECVTNKVHSFLKPTMNKDHFLGLIDWVEAHKPDPAVAKIYSNKKEDGSAFVISSGQRFPISKVDFGWGKPVFGSYHFPWGSGSCGYVMPMPSPLGNGDWIVYMHLPQTQLHFIENQVSDVISPLHWDLILSN